MCDVAMDTSRENVSERERKHRNRNGLKKRKKEEGERERERETERERGRGERSTQADRHVSVDRAIEKNKKKHKISL